MFYGQWQPPYVATYMCMGSIPDSSAVREESGTETTSLLRVRPLLRYSKY